MPSYFHHVEEGEMLRLANSPSFASRPRLPTKTSNLPPPVQQMFTVAHQKISIDVDLASNSIEGITELTIVPLTSKLKVVKLDCREMQINAIYINGIRHHNYIHDDFLYLNKSNNSEGVAPGMDGIFDMYTDKISIHQTYLIKQKLGYMFHENYQHTEEGVDLWSEILGSTQELKILLPENMKFELTDRSALNTPRGSHANTMTPSHLKSKTTAGEIYSPITIKIEYEVKNPQNGVSFITNDDIEKTNWHAYTTNTEYNVSTSSWVPCVDNLSSRNTWSLELSLPRSVRDIGNPRIIGSKEAIRYTKSQLYREKNGKQKESTKTLKTKNRKGQERNKVGNKRKQDHDDKEDDDDEEAEEKEEEKEEEEDDDDDDEVDDENEEEEEQEQEEEQENDENTDLVVCSGDSSNVKETPHPIDLSKKVVSWSIFNSVAAVHIGWAVGCFEYFVLSAGLQDDDNDESETSLDIDEAEEKAKISTPLTIYCLKDDLDLAKTTCAIAPRALDYFLNEFGSFPFSSYSMAFVRFSPQQANSYAGLSILSSSLLYPPDLIEPMFVTTDILLETMAAQWSGVNIVPNTFNDMWLTIGMAGFMAISYIKHLMGSNEYRYKIKMMTKRIVEEDFNKRPIGVPFLKFPVSNLDFEFVRLKAPIVFFILDNRMTKTDKSFGMLRVIPKLFLQAMSGELPNGTLSCDHFQHVCEKVNRNKLDAFFKQWVFGAGAPSFVITQRFNKKKGMLEMTIRQVQQHDRRERKLDKDTYMNDALFELNDEPLLQRQNLFTGPMTIRVHESDGTPYEHIIHIKEVKTTIDLQLNKKVRKIKKKDDGVDPGIPFNQFGDAVPEEAKKLFALQDWERRDEESLATLPFEWIRGDVDFEWIANIEVRQPDYMFGSQLIYDRDVEAQYDAIQYFASVERLNTVYCTALVRTLFDKRYFYGVRIAAAQALASPASNQQTNYLGIKYLIEAFKYLHCFPGSSIPKSNDFADIQAFLIQTAIPDTLSRVTDSEGKVPTIVRDLLYDLVKYNDNSMNEFQDSQYVSKLIFSLTRSAISGWRSDMVDEKDKQFANKVFLEVSRLQKLDEWRPSHNRILQVACFKAKMKMVLVGAHSLSKEDLLFMTLDKHPMESRVRAFKGLLLMGGFESKALLNYYLKVTILNFARPTYRRKLIETLVESLVLIAVHGKFVANDVNENINRRIGDSTNVGVEQLSRIIIDEGQTSNMKAKHDMIARATIKGSVELIRKEFFHNNSLKTIMWELLHTSLLSAYEKRNVFLICEILFAQRDSLIVKLPIPSLPVKELKKKVVAREVGDGIVTLRREGRFKIQLLSRKSASNLPPRVKEEVATQKTPLKLSLKAIDLTNSHGKSKTPVVVKKEKSATNLLPLSPLLSSLLLNNHQIPHQQQHQQKQQKKPMGPLLVSRNIQEPGIVKFTLPSEKLRQIKAHNRRAINSSLVSIDGTNVKIRFAKRHVSVPKVHRYIKIDTKRRKIATSVVPFDSDTATSADSSTATSAATDTSNAFDIASLASITKLSNLPTVTNVASPSNSLSLSREISTTKSRESSRSQSPVKLYSRDLNLPSKQIPRIKMEKKRSSSPEKRLDNLKEGKGYTSRAITPTTDTPSSTRSLPSPANSSSDGNKSAKELESRKNDIRRKNEKLTMMGNGGKKNRPKVYIHFGGAKK